MPVNYGKAFERKFKSDFLKTIPNGTIDRLYDPTNGFVTISNICDFIGYCYPNIFYLECKSHKGNTFPLANLTQYDKLTTKVGIKGVRAGVIVWFVEKDKVLYIPISTISKMKKDDKKSIRFDDDMNKDYFIVNIPSIKKRVFLDSDYSCLLKLEDGQ